MYPMTSSCRFRFVFCDFLNGLCRSYACLFLFVVVMLNTQISKSHENVLSYLPEDDGTVGVIFLLYSTITNKTKYDLFKKISLC